jgi:hypothetical protein
MQHYNNCTNNECPLCKQPINNANAEKIPKVKKVELQQQPQPVILSPSSICDLILKLIEYQSYSNELCRLKLKNLSDMLLESLDKANDRLPITRLDSLYQENETTADLFDYVKDLMKNVEEGRNYLNSCIERLNKYKNEIDVKFQSIAKLNKSTVLVTKNLAQVSDPNTVNLTRIDARQTVEFEINLISTLNLHQIKIGP